MTATRSQIRRMDDVNLLHTLKREERLLARAKEYGLKEAESTLAVVVRELNTEVARREALEAA